MWLSACFWASPWTTSRNTWGETGISKWGAWKAEARVVCPLVFCYLIWGCKVTCARLEFAVCVTSAVSCLHGFFKICGLAIPFFKNAAAEDKEMTWCISYLQHENIQPQIFHFLVILRCIYPLCIFVKQCHSANKDLWFIVMIDDNERAQFPRLVVRDSPGRKDTCCKDCLWISLRDYLITNKIYYLIMVSVGKKTRGWELERIRTGH